MHRKRLRHKTIKAKEKAALPVFGQGGFLRAAKKARETLVTVKWRCFFMPARPFAELRQEKMILHKCSLVLCTKMGYNKIKLLP